MNCKFCGKNIKNDDTICPYCGESQDRITSSEENFKIIDEMPELHDELDKLGEIKKEKNSSVKKRVIWAVIVVVVCLLGSFCGMLYAKHKEAQREALAAATPKTSAVSGEIVKVLEGETATDVQVVDELSAQTAVDSVKSKFGITDERVSFHLNKKITVGSDTYYRFSQLLGTTEVYGCEIILMVDKNGTVKALNGKIAETDGLDLKNELSKGDISNAVIDYTGRVMAEYRIVDGASMTEPEKKVVNFEGKTYLAFVLNMSGYNEKGEFVAYDAFVDADTGNGICIVDTASYENESLEQQTYLNTRFSIYTVNDKFNWNDETMTSAVDIINPLDIDADLTSAYIKSAKESVDSAYRYFEDKFGWRGLDGKGGEFKVYVNANEYVDDKLPPYKAMYSNGVMMFMEEDLISGSLSLDTAVHEYAHGVMDNISNFDGTWASTQSAAISEGCADVFGELAEGFFKEDKRPDWIHGERNIASPSAEYLTSAPETLQVNKTGGTYVWSTIVSHAYYQMWANGVEFNSLNDLLFRSLCMMTADASLSEWREVTEYTAYLMKEEGKISQEEFYVAVSALENTGIRCKRLYPGEIDVLGVLPEEDEGEKVIE